MCTLHITGSTTAVTLNGTNVFLGGIDIAAGGLTLKTQTSAGTAAITNNGTVTLDFFGDFVNNLSGAGDLVKDGTHTVVLTGSASHTGTTTIEDGAFIGGKENVFSMHSRHDLKNQASLNLGGYDQNIGGLTGTADTTVVLGDASLTIVDDNDSTFHGVISGSGGVTFDGGGDTTLTGNNTYTGLTIASAGDLYLGTGGTSGSVAGDMYLSTSSVYFNRSDDITYSGTITGDGALYKVGSGSLTLLGDNAYNGLTEINGGTLQVGNGGTTGAISDLMMTTLRNNATLIFNRSDDIAYTSTLSGTGTVKKVGAGTLVLGDSNDSRITYHIADGTLQMNRSGNTTLNSTILGDGILAYQFAQSSGVLTLGSAVGTGFTGAFQMKKGTIDLNSAGAADFFTNASLKLSSADSYATLSANQTIKDLSFDGGALKVATPTGYILPSAKLTVTDLEVTGNGGAIAMDIDGGIDISVANYGSFYDYADANQAAQHTIIAATSVTGANTQLGLTRYDGTEYVSSSVIRSISDSTGTVGTAIFDYIATVLDTADKKGVYLGYGLKSIQANADKTITLDSDDASGDTAVMNAELTGSGGYTITGSKPTHVGNINSTYTGKTAIDTTAVTMLTDRAFGDTSHLHLTNNASLDMDGKFQKVGALSGEAGTTINVGTLRVDQASDSEYKGTLSGDGRLDKYGSGTLTLSGQVSNARGILLAAGTLALSGSGAITSEGGMTMYGGSTLDISAITAATASLSTLSIYGTNAAVVGNGKTFDLSNTFLHFDLTDTSGTDTVLTADTAIDVANADVRFSGDIPALGLGQGLTLIDNIKNTATDSSVSKTLDNVLYTYTVTSGTSLRLFHSAIETPGDWTAPTNDYTVASGPAAGEGVAVRVGGTLTVPGKLTLDDTNGRGVTLRTAFLNVQDNDVAIDFASTAAWDGTSGSDLGVIRMGGSAARLLDLGGTGLFSASGLELAGSGHRLAGDNKGLDLSGAEKSLSFDLTGVGAGDTVLAADGGLGIDDDTR
ncbi:MAG: autotransporter-associated beta strand repeat-containing protein, partial [Planctomycetes bacterium]|nr:autotransporter-associated beta strand repeat-containing protein [Planctomycetota bacterium]